MAYKHPYNDDLRKTPLNPDMIRHHMNEDAKHRLITALPVGLILIVVSALTLALLLPIYPWDTGTLPLIMGIFMTSLFAVSFVLGVAVIVRAILSFRRAMRGEVVIEQDTVTYIERDRPRTVQRRYSRVVVYEDFLHFKSGREYKVEHYKYREMDDEVFIVVTFSADPDTILRIYRLVDYNWQE